MAEDATIFAHNFRTRLFNRGTQTAISFATSTQQFTVSSARTFTASQVPSSGSVASTTLILTVTNGASITWPTGTKWPGGTVPTLDNGTHIVSMMTYDGGTTFLATALTSYA
jgi:hypothetical protein